MKTESKTYIEKAIDNEMIEEILEQDSGFFSWIDNFGNDIMIYRDLHHGFNVLANNYTAEYNEAGKLIWQ